MWLKYRHVRGQISTKSHGSWLPKLFNASNFSQKASYLVQIRSEIPEEKKHGNVAFTSTCIVAWSSKTASSISRISSAMQPCLAHPRNEEKRWMEMELGPSSHWAHGELGALEFAPQRICYCNLFVLCDFKGVHFSTGPCGTTQITKKT